MLALAAGLGTLLAAGNLLFRHTVAGDTARLLRTRAEAQVAALQVSRNGVRVRGAANDDALDAQAWIFSGSQVIERPVGAPPAVDRVAVRLGLRLRPGVISGPGSVRLLASVLTTPDPRRVVGAVVVGVSTAPFEQLERKVLWGSLLIAALVLLVTGLVVRRALLGALRPVRRMTADAEEWGAHDLDRRFTLGPARDEITGLAVTLDHLLERIAASRRHERRFAADVAHELRTPLARIRGHAELGTNGESHAALAAITDQTERMAATIDTLLAHARREFDPQEGTVDLAAVIAEFEGVELLRDANVPHAEGDAETVRRAIAPLIDNAWKYGRTAAVRIELSLRHDRVQAAVRDDGPGIDPALGERVFEPGVQAVTAPGDGAGLGLPLARRLARACGGDILIGPGPGGCFILELPASEDSRQPGST
jgi:signal transduction histidine kinase